MLDKRTLTKCAYVCSQWHRIAYDESLWQCLNIPCRRMSTIALDNLLKRNIKFLSLSHANVSFLLIILELILIIITSFILDLC
jgi:F-box and leucine-rich repeat protein 1 (S-phase kinase-associated protein 2)